MRTLAGGVSNRTVRVERRSGEAWVVKQALAKLRVAVDWFSDPARVHREAEGTRWLATLAPPLSITPLVFEDKEHHLFAMQAVAEPHANWKGLLLDGELKQDHVAQFARILATIHVNGWRRREQVGLAFRDRSFFEALRLDPYYRYTATMVPEAAGFLGRLIDETSRTRLTLVHGDYSPKNILVHHGRLILLDHEVIHFGDPAFDLGFSLAHLLSKAHHLRDFRQAFAAAAISYWNIYRDTLCFIEWAQELEARAVRHTLACLLARVAGKSQLEYLTQVERTRQAGAIKALMQNTITTLPDLVRSFISRIDTDG
jgi:aminoglycoside phosphotransferase (APT) family kinase protein